MMACDPQGLWGGAIQAEVCRHQQRHGVPRVMAHGSRNHQLSRERPSCHPGSMRCSVVDMMFGGVLLGDETTRDNAIVLYATDVALARSLDLSSRAIGFWQGKLRHHSSESESQFDS